VPRIARFVTPLRAVIDQRDLGFDAHKFDRVITDLATRLDVEPMNLRRVNVTRDFSSNKPAARALHLGLASL
jgi:hypothetical protein